MTIGDDALVAAATLSNRYISGRQLPDKAIDLVDEAAAHLRMELDSSPEEIDELRRQVDRLKMEKSYLLGNPKNDKAAEKAEAELDDSAKDRLADLNQEIADKSEKLNGLKARWDAEKNGHNRIGDLRKKLDELRTQAEKYEREGDLAKSSAINYGEIPAIQKEIAQAEKNERNRAEPTMPTPTCRWSPTASTPTPSPKSSPTGPASPWAVLCRAKTRSSCTWRSTSQARDRPEGSHPSGFRRRASLACRHLRPEPSDRLVPVPRPDRRGQDRARQALADFLFDDEKAMVRIDMSEYMEKAPCLV